MTAFCFYQSSVIFKMFFLHDNYNLVILYYLLMLHIYIFITECIENEICYFEQKFGFYFIELFSTMLIFWSENVFFSDIYICKFTGVIGENGLISEILFSNGDSIF